MSAYSPIATNLVQAGAIYQYVNNINVYKCPADNSAYKFGAVIIPHVRSYSMNFSALYEGKADRPDSGTELESGSAIFQGHGFDPARPGHDLCFHRRKREQHQ